MNNNGSVIICFVIGVSVYQLLDNESMPPNDKDVGLNPATTRHEKRTLEDPLHRKVAQ